MDKYMAWCSNVSFMIKFLCVLLMGLVLFAARESQADVTNKHAFEGLQGWWIGSGRLGFENGKTEQVKCRATYKLIKLNRQEMRQVVRCASASGNVEVESHILQNGEALTGTWVEKRYEFEGDITGRVLKDGFRVTVKGKRLVAEMTISLRKDKHIIEIQFMKNALIGLSMVFTRR